MTAGIAALPALDQAAILGKVMMHSEFAEDNDPHGEHDFGAFGYAGERIFWKIDYYDPSMRFGSEDPADPAKTTRRSRATATRRGSCVSYQSHKLIDDQLVPNKH